MILYALAVLLLFVGLFGGIAIHSGLLLFVLVALLLVAVVERRP